MAPFVWFITGTSSGLGAAIAEHALKRGDQVAATARDVSQIQHFADTYGSDKALVLRLDVTKYDEAQSTIKAAFDKFGRIDLLINNAGYANFRTVEDSSMDEFSAQVETNFMGVVNVTKVALPYLRKQRSGHIFQVSSIGGRVGTPGFSAYQSAKWAVGGFSTVLAQEVAPFGIKVTVLEPGAMSTKWASKAMKEQAPPISEAYLPHVKPLWDMFKGFAQGGIGSDLDKIAEIIVKVSESESPPVKLTIGSDAYIYAQKTAEALKETDEKWKEVSISADKDWDQGKFDRTVDQSERKG